MNPKHRKRLADKKRIAAYLSVQYDQAVKDTESRDIFGWFNYWHTHIDWKSRCNRLPETRALVARLTYRLLLVAEKHFAPRQEPFQLFADIDNGDTGSNAVYVHTANPYSPYPCELEVEWGAATPSELAGVMDLAAYEIGQYDKTRYFIRRRESVPIGG